MTTPSKVIPVGSMWSNNGAITTLAVNPTTVGDILVLATATYGYSDLVTAVSGGGVTTWTELIYALPSGGEGSTSLWWGVITSPGPSTITITTLAPYTNFLVCQQFTMGGAGVWTADGSAASTSTAHEVSGTMPSVTPSTTGPELYIGALMSSSTGGTGADPDVVYEGTGTVAITGWNYGLLFLYNPNAGLPLAEAPAWGAPVSYGYVACSALIIAERPFYAPLAPTLLSPPATAYIDATQVRTFSALYNANDSWPMSAYALRLKIVGGAYAYWNAVTQALQPAEVWNAVTPAVANGGTISVVLPAYTLLNGLSYDFSFATQESGADLDGPFATDVAFTAQAAPVVTITAPAAIAVGTATPTVSWSNVLAPSTFPTVGSALAVGTNPYGIAIDPTGTYAYTANYSDSTVTKINLSTFLTVGSALTVGSNPYGIAIDPTGTYAYVANYYANTVTKINLSTFATVGSALAVGSNPFSIAIDPTGTYAYVANSGDSTVTKINLSTFATVGSALAVGTNPHGIAIDPAGAYAYVANSGDSTVTKINLSTFATVGSALAVGTNPHGIAIDPAGAYAYVANYYANTVTKINLSTFATVGSALAVGSNPFSIAIDPAGAYAYVANYSGNSVTKINLSTFLTVGSALTVGSNPYGIAIDPAGAYAYVANFSGNSVTKINLRTSQTGYEIVVESGSYATGPGAAPGSGTQVYDSGVVSSAALSAVTGTLAQPGLYCAFVRITETGSEVSAWNSQVFVCEATAPPTPTWISATAGNDPITGAPMATLVLSVSDTGFTGQCSLAVLRSDGAYVRGYGWPSGTYTPIPAGGGSFTVYDYETVPGTSYTYTAQLLAWPPLTGLWSASSGSVTTTTNNAWFILDPTNVATAAQFFPGTLTFVDHEAATTFEPLGTRGTLIKSGAGMKGRQGSIAAGVVTQAAYQQLRAVLLNTGTLLLQGPLEQQYVTVFGDRSGALTPTTAAAPSGNYWDVITFVTVEQTRP